MKITTLPKQNEKPPEGWWIGKESSCAWCKTGVQLERADTVHEDMGEYGWYALFYCPLCKKPMSVYLTHKKHEEISH